jgi:hypothetical protein
MLRPARASVMDQAWEIANGHKSPGCTPIGPHRSASGLALVEATLRMERELGRPFTEETARKVEGYARFGFGDPKARREK